MLHPKQHITDLSEICFRKGVKYIVISPGSRNAPLIESFTARFGDNCISIVDERSAGYFALGLARFEKSPVALICTSGTAVLNYGPALAEAYYARVPLLAITADRPIELIDQQDNQTIRQRDVYRNFVKSSYNLPELMDSRTVLQKTHKLLQQAIDNTISPYPGPIHINVPLHEPLYDRMPPVSESIQIDYSGPLQKELRIHELLLSQWKSSSRIMILHGHDYRDPSLNDLLSQLSNDPGVVVVAENISNITGSSIIANPELLMSLLPGETPETPELLIYSGGQLVSKRLKQYLKEAKKINVWRIGIDTFPIDTFKQSNRIVPVQASELYTLLAATEISNRSSTYKAEWQELNQKALKKRNNLLQKIPFSDLSAIYTVLKQVPHGTILELGNSTPVRFSQRFDTIGGVEYYSNRGVSGIDGCLSSAVGTAYASQKLTIAIIGDLSFVYDSNALWNKRLPANLRVIVLNNGGGGIFSLLEGPSSKASFTDYIEAAHPVNIQKLAEAFNLEYSCVDDDVNLVKVLPGFLVKSERARVLEIITLNENNIKAFNLLSGKTRE